APERTLRSRGRNVRPALGQRLNRWPSWREIAGSTRPSPALAARALRARAGRLAAPPGQPPLARLGLRDPVDAGPVEAADDAAVAPVDAAGLGRRHPLAPLADVRLGRRDPGVEPLPHRPRVVDLQELDDAVEGAPAVAVDEVVELDLQHDLGRHRAQPLVRGADHPLPDFQRLDRVVRHVHLLQVAARDRPSVADDVDEARVGEDPQERRRVGDAATGELDPRRLAGALRRGVDHALEQAPRRRPAVALEAGPELLQRRLELLAGDEAVDALRALEPAHPPALPAGLDEALHAHPALEQVGQAAAHAVHADLGFDQVVAGVGA